MNDLQTLVLKIQYDGTDYAGWQRQPNAPTVQGEIEKALKKICSYNLSVVAAGRTDAGVHARGMTAHAYLSRGFPVKKEKIHIAVNSYLPRDIRILSAGIIDFKFNARFDASAREYSYYIYKKDDVFLRRYAWQIKFPFSPKKLSEAAEVFLGKHDFTAFSKHNPETKSYLCSVDICEWIKEEKLWKLKIRADRFVYGMVRSLTGAMIEAARGKITTDDLKIFLAEKDRNNAPGLAPPHGLFFEKAYYPFNIEL